MCTCAPTLAPCNCLNLCILASIVLHIAITPGSLNQTHVFMKCACVEHWYLLHVLCISSIMYVCIRYSGSPGYVRRDDQWFIIIIIVFSDCFLCTVCMCVYYIHMYMHCHVFYYICTLLSDVQSAEACT